MGSTLHGAGIAAVGFYLPRYAIAAEEYRQGSGHPAAEGIEERSVAGFDEDPITMAVEAGERALTAARARGVDVLVFATSGTVGGGGLVA
ncbi:MAG: hypothetical protein AABY30_03420, partial [Candidatus Thermoplasmatota archaeon]